MLEWHFGKGEVRLLRRGLGGFGCRFLSLDAGPRDMQTNRRVTLHLHGYPNAGKSSLMRSMLMLSSNREKMVSAVSPKANTTSRSIGTRLTFDWGEFEVLDHPGYLGAGKTRIACGEGDVLSIVLDCTNRASLDKWKKSLSSEAWSSRAPCLVLNKVDLLRDKRSLLSLTDNLVGSKLNVEGHVFYTDAKRGEGVEDIIEVSVSCRRGVFTYALLCMLCICFCEELTNAAAAAPDHQGNGFIGWQR